MVFNVGSIMVGGCAVLCKFYWYCFEIICASLKSIVNFVIHMLEVLSFVNFLSCVGL